MNFKNYRKGLIDGVPICLGYLAVGITFGIAAVKCGLTVVQAVLISLTNFTSAGQFAGINIIAASGTYLEVAVSQLVINLRYSLMSFSLSQKMEKRGKRLHRFVTAFGVGDEIFGISMSQKGRVSPYYIYGAMSVAIPGWVLGTLAGAVLGNVLPEAVVGAMGVAIYGMFFAIIIPPAKAERVILKVIVGAMLVSTLFEVIPALDQVSDGFVIIITTVLVAGAAAYFRPVKEKEEQETYAA